MDQILLILGISNYPSFSGIFSREVLLLIVQIMADAKNISIIMYKYIYRIFGNKKIIFYLPESSISENRTFKIPEKYAKVIKNSRERCLKFNHQNPTDLMIKLRF